MCESDRCVQASSSPLVALTVAVWRRSRAIATRPRKHVWRAQIVLLSAAGLGTNEIMRRTGKSKTCVWRWQERFAQEGYDGLLRDKTRRSRIAPLGAALDLDFSNVAASWSGDPRKSRRHRAQAMKILETLRLILRQLPPDDLDSLFTLYQSDATRLPQRVPCGAAGRKGTG